MDVLTLHPPHLVGARASSKFSKKSRKLTHRRRIGRIFLLYAISPPLGKLPNLGKFADINPPMGLGRIWPSRYYNPPYENDRIANFFTKNPKIPISHIGSGGYGRRYSIGPLM